jgi:hypothetical protein
VSPIVTTGPASAGALAGAVGQPSTVPVFGGRRVLGDWRSGLRVETGVWFDDDHRNGMSARIYTLFGVSDKFDLRANGAAVVNVPHFVPVGSSAVQIPVFVGFPGLTTGTVDAGARSSFVGGDLNFRRVLDRGDSYRVELLAGYRQLHLGDSLSDAFTVTPVGAAAFALPHVTGYDAVRTENNFAGPQLGLFAATSLGRLTLDVHSALALGATASDLSFIRMRTRTPNPASTALLTAGGVAPAAATVLAAATNRFPLTGATAGGNLTYFGLVGEGGVRLNWLATDYFRLTSGYSFLYWNNVRRAQELFANSTVLHTHAVDFTTHLFSLGLDVRY